MAHLIHIIINYASVSTLVLLVSSLKPTEDKYMYSLTQSHHSYILFMSMFIVHPTGSWPHIHNFMGKSIILIVQLGCQCRARCLLLYNADNEP